MVAQQFDSIVRLGKLQLFQYALGLDRVRVLNDLEALAYGVTLLEGDELVGAPYALLARDLASLTDSVSTTIT